MTVSRQYSVQDPAADGADCGAGGRGGRPPPQAAAVQAPPATGGQVSRICDNHLQRHRVPRQKPWLVRHFMCLCEGYWGLEQF